MTEMFETVVKDTLEIIGDEDLAGAFTDIFIQKTVKEKKPREETTKEQISA